MEVPNGSHGNDGRTLEQRLRLIAGRSSRGSRILRACPMCGSPATRRSRSPICRSSCRTASARYSMSPITARRMASTCIAFRPIAGSSCAPTQAGRSSAGPCVRWTALSPHARSWVARWSHKGVTRPGRRTRGLDIDLRRRDHVERDASVEDGRGSLGHSASLRFPSLLIEPDARCYRIRLSNCFHRVAHDGAFNGRARAHDAERLRHGGIGIGV